MNEPRVDVHVDMFQPSDTKAPLSVHMCHKITQFESITHPVSYWNLLDTQ